MRIIDLMLVVKYLRLRNGFIVHSRVIFLAFKKHFECGLVVFLLFFKSVSIGNHGLVEIVYNIFSLN